ncbi:hypothetical protein [Mycobacterium tuberculosis]|uniref:hypothetical protein n=1 Tax=Mycobacterium tuberculosis TaxID=1773 RepID=UPI00350EC8A2
MRRLLQLLDALPTDNRVGTCVQFFCTLTKEENRKHSITDLWRGLTDKLALRITEHASQSGEKYATETRSEYWKMARAANRSTACVGFCSSWMPCPPTIGWARACSFSAR